MKKYITLLICISLFSILLCGCTSTTKGVVQYDTPLYSITETNGRYNLNLTNPTSELDAWRIPPYPKFKSVKEMRQAIFTGSFTEEELYALSCSSPNTDDGIEICDLEHLYELTAPSDLSLKEITWQGIRYLFKLDGTNVFGGVYCFDKDEYTEHFRAEYKSFLTNPLETFIKQEEKKERSATIYYYQTSVAKIKYICYEICVGNKKMHIQEEYLIEIEDNRQPVSSEVPCSIEFWGTENDGYFYGIFYDFEERPSVEWLSEFGITPYLHRG